MIKKGLMTKFFFQLRMPLGGPGYYTITINPSRGQEVAGRPAAQDGTNLFLNERPFPSVLSFTFSLLGFACQPACVTRFKRGDGDKNERTKGRTDETEEGMKKLTAR